MASILGPRFLPFLFYALAFFMWLFLSFAEDALTVFQQKPLIFSPIRAVLKDPVGINHTPAVNISLPNFYVRDRVSKRLKKWQIIQIYKTNVKPEDFDFQVNETLLLRDCKTESIPAQQTCAVVGNSGILSNSTCGSMIDSHDFVFRMNLSPFGLKYGEDVGYKANITTLNYSQLKSAAKCAKKHFPNISVGCQDTLTKLKLYNNSVVWYPKGGSRKGNMNVLSRGMIDSFGFNARWAYSPASLFGVVPRIWKKRTPSTGLLILSAASLFCERITMFGFYPFSVDAHNRTLTYHYYDSFPMNHSTNAHKMPVEFKIYRQLQNQSAVELQLGECN
nr:alpha-2,8-sialyltransferase 8B-like [Lytechinus pictus]